MPQDSSKLSNWLEQASLGKYAEAFDKAAIDLDVVADLTESDLAELGMPIGDRRRFWRLLKTAPPGGPGTAVSPNTVTTAEHKAITVLFCDLVGWTGLSTQFESEDLSDMLNDCRVVWTEAIERFDGFVAQRLGDGMMAYFGHPRAHEDSPERAILSGLDIVRAIQNLSTNSRNPIAPHLLVRVGISTGKVLVNKTMTGALEEVDVLGYTPNFAARLQGQAKPNSVVVSATTAQLAQDRFRFSVRKGVEIKGVSGNSDIYEVTGRVRSGDLDTSRIGDHDLPIVGRLHEIGLLEERWKVSKEGNGQAVLLSGQAGIGKSCAANALFERVKAPDTMRIRLTCSSYYSNSSLHPIVDFIQTRADINDADKPGIKSGKLKAFLDARGITRPLDRALLANLLLIPVEANRLPAMSAERLKTETMESITKLLLQEADKRPTMIVLEDAHWADSTSMELLEKLVRETPPLKAMLVITTRDDEAMQIKRLPNVTSLTLGRLSRSEGSQIIRNISPDIRLADNLVDQILAKSDGIPLFLEEMTKTVRANIDAAADTDASDQAHAASRVPIPATLYDSLLSRLDRFPEAKSAAGGAATIGREFTLELLSAVLDLPSEETQRMCAFLTEAGLVVKDTRKREPSYNFKHALVQDAVYESMTRNVRRALHGRIALILESSFHSVVIQSPEIVAQHYQLSGDEDKALEHWERAGRLAMEHSATIEAQSHLSKAISILESHPNTTENLRRKIAVLTSYGAALTSVKGYTAPETMAAYDAAWKLSEACDDTTFFHDIIYGMWNSAQVGSDYDRAQALANMCLSYSEQQKDDVTRLVAHNLCGVTALLRGQHKMAYTHLKKSSDIYDPVRFQSMAIHTGEDPGVESLSHLSLNRWYVGDAKAALQYAERARELAHEIAYKHSQVYYFTMAGVLLHYLRMHDEVIVMADEMVQMSKRQNYPYFVEWGLNLKGWALAETGEPEEGLALMANTWQQGFSSLLFAKVCRRMSRVDTGMRSIDSVIKTQPWLAPEALRIKGELFLQGPNPNRPAAHQCFQEALKMAQDQGAASVSLKIAISIAQAEIADQTTDTTTEHLRQAISGVKDDYLTRDLHQARELLHARMRKTTDVS